MYIQHVQLSGLCTAYHCLVSQLDTKGLSNFGGDWRELIKSRELVLISSLTGLNDPVLSLGMDGSSSFSSG